MKPFSLKIITPNGVRYEGPAEELVVRTTTGDAGILAGHINYVASLGMGEAAVIIDGQKRCGACIGGMVSVMDGAVTLLPTTFEWADEIDPERAEASQKKAEDVLSNSASGTTDILLAKARLKRALVRKSVYNRKIR